MQPQQPLSQDNLLPIYLIQDKLQSNFKKINTHILQASQHHSSIISDIALLRNEQYTMKNSFALRMQEMEKKIVAEIGMELEGRIAIAIGKSIDSLMGKMEQRDRNMGDVKDEFQGKLKKMKEELKYQVALDNQKYFIKETKKLQENLKRQFNSSSSISAVPARKRSTNNPDPNPNSSLHPQQPSSENPGKWQQQHHQITSLQSRIISLQEFSVNVDKRMYNGLTSIKESWKELGAELLENKKNLIKKFDELRIDFIKLKGLKEFSIAPDKIEDEFKHKLNQKFTDIYQLLSITLTKNEYESSYERITQKLSRHDDDFIEMRKELATNNQFFTFYANNANQDDLKKDIGELFARVEEDRREIQDGLEKVNQKINGNYSSISDIERDIRKVKDNFDVKVKLIDSMNQLVNSVKDRIQNLQDFNRFGPDKLQKIHNALDIDFTATQRQLIDAKSKKQNLSNVEQSQRELRIEMNKMKDQMFLLASQNQVKDQELLQMRKNYKELELKIQKFKGESEEAMASRKPWVCLSCDKQEKEKQQVKKESKIKRPQPFKGFPQQRSQKVLKPPTTPPYEQRFQVYDKFREKYLSDTIKLPQIFREKLKDKDTSIQN